MVNLSLYWFPILRGRFPLLIMLASFCVPRSLPRPTVLAGGAAVAGGLRAIDLAPCCCFLILIVSTTSTCSTVAGSSARGC